MNNIVSVWPKATPKYIFEIIVNNYCKSIMPAVMVEEEKNSIIKYSLENARAINEFIDPISALEFILEVAGIIKDLEDKLIFQDTYKLSLENIYLDLRRGKYVVALKPRDEDLCENHLKHILEEMIEISNDSCIEYLLKVKPIIIDKDHNHKALISKIEKLCKEISFLS